MHAQKRGILAAIGAIEFVYIFKNFSKKQFQKQIHKNNYIENQYVSIFFILLTL